MWFGSFLLRRSFSPQVTSYFLTVHDTFIPNFTRVPQSTGMFDELLYCPIRGFLQLQ